MGGRAARGSTRSHAAHRDRRVDARRAGRAPRCRASAERQRPPRPASPAPGAQGRPAASSASRCTTSRRSAGGSSRRRASAIVARAPEHVVDERVEHLGLVAQQLGAARARSPRPPGGPRAAPGASPWRTRARANAGPALLSSSRQRSPRAAQYARRLLAREPEQRPHEQPRRGPACRAARAGSARTRAGRGSSRPGRWRCARRRRRRPAPAPARAAAP